MAATSKRTKAAANKPTKKEVRRQPAPPREQLTVNGKRIPEHLIHAVPFELTDQGKQQLNQARDNGPSVQVRDRFDKQIDARADAGEGKLDPWMSPDPAKEAIERVAEPGFRHRLLSKDAIDRRGLRGWEIVQDPENGGPATMGDRMLIGRMPEEVADRRNQHYRGQGNDAVRQAEEHFQTEQDRILREGEVSGVRPLKPGEILRDRADGERIATAGLRQESAQEAASHFSE